MPQPLKHVFHSIIYKVSVKTFSIISWNVPARRKRQKIGSGWKGKLRKCIPSCKCLFVLCIAPLLENGWSRFQLQIRRFK